MDDSHVSAFDLPPVDLGHGVEHFLFNWDDPKTRPYPMARWVTGEGDEVWLSTRHLQCLALALSVGAQEGAFRLGISVGTFKKHLTKMFQRLRVTTKWEAATELGWVSIPASLQATLTDDVGARGPQETGRTAPSSAPATPTMIRRVRSV